MTTPADIAVEARRLINRDGWTQGDFGSRDHGWCLVGACQRAAEQPLDSMRPGQQLAGLYSLLMDELDTHRILGYVPDSGMLIRWNDAPTRTQDEVLSLLSKIAGPR